MKHIGIVLIISAVYMANFSSAFAGTGFRPGMWETMMTMDMQGMPMRIPAITSRQCMTRKNQVAQASKGKGECSTTSKQVKGNKVSWDIVCQQQGTTMRGHGAVTYGSDTFEGYMEMRAESGGTRMPIMRYELMGRRIGPCK